MAITERWNSMKKLFVLLFLQFLLVATGEAKIADERMVIGALSIGQTVKEVEMIYGKPAKISNYKIDPNRMTYEYGKGGSQFTIVFKNNKIVSITVKGYDKVATIDGIMIGTPKKFIIEAYGQPDFTRGDGKQPPDSEYMLFITNSGRISVGGITGRMLFDLRKGQVVGMSII